MKLIAEGLWRWSATQQCYRTGKKWEKSSGHTLKSNTSQSLNARNSPKQFSKGEFVLKCQSKCINKRSEAELAYFWEPISLQNTAGMTSVAMAKGAVASLSSPAGSWCQKLSEVRNSSPSYEASQPELRARLVNLQLRSLALNTPLNLHL